MVCMGNICRSPIAEGVLRTRLAAAGLQDRIAVDSAGTHAYHVGDPPDLRAQRQAKARGVDLGAQRARQVQGADFLRFDLILAMDDANLEALERVRAAAPGGPHAPARLLLEFARQHAGEPFVPDPYYGGPEGFERVLDLVEDACDGLLAHLRERLARVSGGAGDGAGRVG